MATIPFTDQDAREIEQEEEALAQKAAKMGATPEQIEAARSPRGGSVGDFELKTGPNSDRQERQFQKPANLQAIADAGRNPDLSSIEGDDDVPLSDQEPITEDNLFSVDLEGRGLEVGLDEDAGGADVYQEQPIQFAIPHKNETKTAASLDAAVAIAQGADPVEAFNKAMTLDDPTLIGEARVERTQAQLTGELNDVITEANNQQIQLNPERMADKAKGIPALKEGSFAYYKASIAGFPNSDLLDPKLVDTLAAQLYMQADLAKQFDEHVSWSVDTAMDVLGYLALGDDSINISVLAGMLDGTGAAADEFLSSGQYLLQLGRTMATLPPEESVLLYNNIKNAYPEIDDNELQKILLLASVISGDSLSTVGSGEIIATDVLDKAGLALDVGTVVIPFLKIAKGIAANNSLLKIAAAAGETRLAGDIVELSMNPDTAKLTGVSPLNAAASLDPTFTTDMSKIIKGVPEEIQPAIQARFNTNDAIMNQGLDVPDEALGLSSADVLKKNDIIKAQVEANPQTANVIVETLDNRTAQITYDVVDGTGKKILKNVTQKQSYVIDDLGVYTQTPSQVLTDPLGLGLVISPNAKLRGVIGEDLVNGWERIAFQRAKVEGAFSETLLGIFKPLNGKNTVRVQNVLARGNSGEGFDYDWHKLTNVGFDGGSLTLSPKEATAYIETRRLLRQMGTLKNQQLVQDFKARGIRQFDLDGTPARGKEYETAQAAQTAFAQARTDSRIIGINDTGKYVNSSRNDNLDIRTLDEYYDRGYRLIRATADDTFTKNGISTDWMFVKGSKEVRGQVLDIRPGYIPQIREGSTWFVKESVDLALDGGSASRTRQITHGYTNNFQEGTAMLAKIQADNPDKVYKLQFDREMTSGELEGEVLQMSGGFMTGSRSSHIKYGLEGTDGELVGALESIQEAITHVARSMTGSTYKIGMQEKFVTTAKDWGALVGYKGGFKESLDAIVNSDIDEKLKRTLVNAHKQLSFMSGIPTKFDEDWIGVKRSIGKAAEIPVGLLPKGKIQDVGKDLIEWGFYNNSNPITSKARAMAFTFSLGMFNVSQSIIQMSGMALAATANPLSFAKGLEQSLAASMLDMAFVRNIETAQQITKYLDSKGIGIDREAYKMWKQSGLKESILRVNDDYKALHEGLPTSGTAIGQFAQRGWGLGKRTVNVGTAPFVAGELVAARQSFFTAVDWYKGLKGAKGLDTEDARKAIMARTEDYRLHMSRANTASFQKGLLGTTLQYKQVMTKFTEALLTSNDRGFSLADRGRIVALSGVLYGANGVPFLDVFSEEALDSVFDINAGNTSELDLMTWKKGFVARYVDAPFNVDFSDRVALGAGLTESIFDFMANAQDNPLELLAGPFGNLAGRTFRGMNDVFLTMNGVTSIEDESISMKTKLHAVAGVMGKSLAELPSSTRNLMTAHIVRESGYYRNSKGQEVIPALNFDDYTAFATALGFSPSELDEFYSIGDGKRTNAKALAGRDAPQLMVSLMAKMVDSNVEESQAYKIAAQAVLGSFHGEERRQIVQKTIDRLKSPTTAWDTKLMQLARDFELELTTSNDRLNTALARRNEQGGGLE